MVGIVRLFFTSSFQSGRSLIESALNVDHAKLPVFAFTVGCHRPEKANAMTRNRDIWMIPAGHQHGVTIAHNGDDFRIVSTVIDKLYAKCRIGHIEIHIHLFEHLGVLVRWPARPVAGFGNGEPGDQPSRFYIFASSMCSWRDDPDPPVVNFSPGSVSTWEKRTT